MNKSRKPLTKISRLLVIFLFLLTLNGCATICGDNTRTMYVQSRPQGAGVYIDGVCLGTTPTAITLPHYIYGSRIIQLKKNGYYDQFMVVGTRFQPCTLCNVLFWPGFVIDGITGNIVKIEFPYLSANMEAEEPENSPPQTKSYNAAAQLPSTTNNVYPSGNHTYTSNSYSNTSSSYSNGYGEISKATGRAKTVHVKGYYRKDGTYVRSHYRSPPRRKGS